MLICQKCNKEFPSWKNINGTGRNISNRKYCLECSPFKEHNTKKIHIDNKPDRFCMFCGDKLSKLSNKWHGKYCSNNCQKAYEWQQVKENIKKSDYSIKSSRIAKRYLKEKQGIQCNICGFTEWMGKEIPLVLDHIDGNSDNWHLENLRLICGNCDMQTSTYKGKNIGKGRYYRRQRYKEGKSY